MCGLGMDAWGKMYGVLSKEFEVKAGHQGSFLCSVVEAEL